MFTPAPRFSVRWVFAASTGLVFSLTAFHWLTSLPRAEYMSLALRAGFSCAVYCVLAVVVFCWGAILAYVARSRKWAPKTCRLAGLTVLLLLAVEFSKVDEARLAALLNTWIFSGLVAGFICQKLTYPDATTDELNAPEPPLSLFPK
jgi:hypothetical protein